MYDYYDTSNLPLLAMKMYLRAYNRMYDVTYDKNRAAVAGWTAVKHRYVHLDNKWLPKDLAVAIMSRELDDDYSTTEDEIDNMSSSEE
jgi:hypothetical protein